MNGISELLVSTTCFLAIATLNVSCSGRYKHFKSLLKGLELLTQDCEWAIPLDELSKFSQYHAQLLAPSNSLNSINCIVNSTMQGSGYDTDASIIMHLPMLLNSLYSSANDISISYMHASRTVSVTSFCAPAALQVPVHAFSDTGVLPRLA